MLFTSVFSDQKGSSVFDEAQWGDLLEKNKKQMKTTNKREAGVKARGDSAAAEAACGFDHWCMWLHRQCGVKSKKGRCHRRGPVQQGPRGQFTLEATYRNHCRVFVFAEREREIEIEKKGNITHARIWKCILLFGRVHFCLRFVNKTYNQIRVREQCWDVLMLKLDSTTARTEPTSFSFLKPTGRQHTMTKTTFHWNVWMFFKDSSAIKCLASVASVPSSFVRLLRYSSFPDESKTV